MKNKDKNKKQENDDNRKKWQDISDKTDEAHRKSLEAIDKAGDKKAKDLRGASEENSGEEDWQQLDKNERDKRDERRGGYPKNVYKKGEE